MFEYFRFIRPNLFATAKALKAQLEKFGVKDASQLALPERHIQNLYKTLIKFQKKHKELAGISLENDGPLLQYDPIVPEPEAAPEPQLAPGSGSNSGSSASSRVNSDVDLEGEAEDDDEEEEESDAASSSGTESQSDGNSPLPSAGQKHGRPSSESQRGSSHKRPKKN